MQILLLAKLLPSVGLMFPVGVYKYSVMETHPLEGGGGHHAKAVSTAPPSPSKGGLPPSTAGAGLCSEEGIFFRINMNFPSI